MPLFLWMFSKIEERFFDLDKKSRLLPYLIDFIDFTDKFDYKDYKLSILDKRNKLAHELETERDGALFFGNFEFSPEQATAIRRDIKKYKEFLKRLLDNVKSLNN